MVNCAVVWTFFGTTFLWDWNENWAKLKKKKNNTGEKQGLHTLQVVILHIGFSFHCQ